MTAASTRRILWAALLLTLPIPYWVMEGGWVPAIWLLELAGFTIAVWATEGGSIVALITGLFVLQVILAAAASWVIARLLARGLGRLLPERWRTAGVVGTLALLLGVACLRVYATPLVAGGARVNLLQLFA